MNAPPLHMPFTTDFLPFGWIVVVVKCSGYIYICAALPPSPPLTTPSRSLFSASLGGKGGISCIKPWIHCAPKQNPARPVTKPQRATLAEHKKRTKWRLIQMQSAIDIDVVSCSSFDLPIVASWRSIIKGYSLFCSLAVCKMAALQKSLVASVLFPPGFELSCAAAVPWLVSIRDAFFDAVSVGCWWWSRSVDTRISWETHTHLWPRPSGWMLQTPPFGKPPVHFNFKQAAVAFLVLK